MFLLFSGIYSAKQDRDQRKKGGLLQRYTVSSILAIVLNTKNKLAVFSPSLVRSLKTHILMKLQTGLPHWSFREGATLDAELKERKGACAR